MRSLLFLAALLVAGMGFQANVRNLVTRSEQLDNPAWTQVRLTGVTADAATAPDGTVSADALVENGLAGTHYLRLLAFAKDGIAIRYTLSAFVKANSRSWVQLNVDDNVSSSNGANAIFDLSTGTIDSSGDNGNGAFSDIVPAIESLPNGWYRVSLTFTTNTTESINCDFRLHNGTSTSYNGDGSSNLYVWGAQLNRGGLKNYVSTTSAARTKAF